MHPHIIRLYEVVETPTDIFVVRAFPLPNSAFSAHLYTLR